MATVSDRIEYLAALALTRLAQSVAPRTADRFGAALGSIAHALISSRRRIAFDNLKRALGSDYSDDELRALTRRVFQNAGRTAVEVARFPVMTRDEVKRITVGAGADQIMKVQAEGKGAIFLTAHFGNWELLGAWLATVASAVSFVVATQHNRKFDELLLSFRKTWGVGVIQLPSGAREVFRALRANQVVAIVPDQHAASAAVVLDFFGRPAATVRGPALFSLKAGSPIIPYLLRRERYDRHVVIAGQAIYPPRLEDEEQAVRQITEKYTRFFEEQIRRYPDQWLWTHRRWKLPGS
ncbi:MAG TPA: lysophospholipid acyltransferase family protein [Acidobacteriota bacterium]|nr:lysophospholipid acyltransferase family protein [Acidobacteriota bacterium]